MSGPWLQIGINYGLLILGVGLFILAWWALFADRARGRRRCPRCWFDMSRTDGMICNECGYAARTERDLERTRPKRSLAVLAILGCSLVGAYGIERGRTRGWSTYLPTGIVVRLLPLSGPDNRALVDDLIRRGNEGRLDRAHYFALLDLAIAGDAGAAPPTPAWESKYGRLLGPVAFALAETPADRNVLRDELLDLPMAIELESRAFWPIGVAPTVDVTVRHLWPSLDQFPLEPRARVHISGTIVTEAGAGGGRVGGTIECAPDIHELHKGSIQSRSYSYMLPPLPRGEHEARLLVRMEQRLDDEGPWAPAGERTISLAVRVERPMADFLEPVRGPDLDAAIQQAFSGGLVKYGSGSLPVRISVDQRATLIDAFDGVAVGVRLEVRRNGVTGRALETWWPAGAGTARGNGRRSSWEVPYVDDAVLLPPLQPDDVWTVHVESVPELALRVENAERYWEGSVEFEVPIGLARGGGEAPPRGWIPADDPALSSEQ